MKSRRGPTIVLLGIFLAAALSAGQPKNRSSYPSPDKACIAVITDMKTPFPYVTEGVIEFHGKNGKLLFAKSYTSKSGDRGYYVGLVGWTADSKYFVYSIESSGGRQSWHQGIEIYSRSSNGIAHLDDYIGPVTMRQQVALAPPDSVIVTVTDTIHTEVKSQDHRVAISTLLRSAPPNKR